MIITGIYSFGFCHNDLNTFNINYYILLDLSSIFFKNITCISFLKISDVNHVH